LITFPKTLEAAAKARGEVRAGGTDLQERRYLGIASGDLRDLRDLEGASTIEWVDGGLTLGARVRIADIASDRRVVAGYPGLAAAAGGLATPQIRALATLGGNLLQEVRCWYYRNPETLCLKRGGASCLARDGDNLYSSCFDLGPCVAPHPSTLGLALLAYDAVVDVFPRGAVTMAALFGDGSDPARTHRVGPREIVASVRLPPPIAGERAAYFRAISRARAEWSLVEVIVRLVVDEGVIRLARVALGGVANIPLRLPAVERRLEAAPCTLETFTAAAALASEGAQPLAMTGYKVSLIPGTVLEALEMASGVR
jgi:xanthine dehydrogenase YagS FAD-binding subunit